MPDYTTTKHNINNYPPRRADLLNDYGFVITITTTESTIKQLQFGSRTLFYENFKDGKTLFGNIPDVIFPNAAECIIHFSVIASIAVCITNLSKSITYRENVDLLLMCIINCGLYWTFS